MTADTSFFSYLLNASFIVKCVILILVFASIVSWTVIVERVRYYKTQLQLAQKFEERFWSGVSLQDLYQSTLHDENPSAILNIFHCGFKAFSQFQSTGNHSRDDVIIGAQRAMQIAESKAMDQLEEPLSLLATIGSVSPFIGLFGTVWGIMTAFQALGTVQQASIAMVAPGISEALMTTAIGLFAAIPAAIAYNRFNQQVSRMQNYFDTFSNELTNILHKQ
jgi:biopolymer transport protein TolQ